MQGLDIETTSLHPDEGRIRLVQIRDGATGRVYELPYNNPRTALLTLRDPVAHHAPFEREWIRSKFGIDLGAMHDTLVMSAVLHGGTFSAKSPRFSHGLGAVLKRELGVEISKEEQTSDWGAETLTREQIEYAARDAHYLPELANTLLRALEREGLMEVYELERRCSHAVAAMERNGIAVDRAKLDAFIAGNTERAERLRGELEGEWGINPGSSKQLREHFKLDERKGWPITPAGAPKTDQEAMKLLADEHPSIEKWLEWKGVEKLRSTYGTSIAKKIDADGRLRARFNQFATATGRFSSSSPNMQNIPRDADIRALFWSGSEDRVLITADYASIEVWIAAIRWSDARMKQVLAEGTNIHKATAAALYGLPVSEVTAEEKAVGKTTNFALLYGAGANRLRAGFEQAGIPMSDEEAWEIFRKFFDTYKGFARKRAQARKAWEEGEYTESRTAIGRRRNFGDWHGPLMNHEIQGTGADGIKFALARMYEDREKFPTARVVATVHDEIIVEADKGESDEVKAWVEGHMVGGMLDAMKPHKREIPTPPTVEISVDRVWTK